MLLLHIALGWTDQLLFMWRRKNGPEKVDLKHQKRENETKDANHMKILTTPSTSFHHLESNYEEIIPHKPHELVDLDAYRYVSE